MFIVRYCRLGKRSCQLYFPSGWAKFTMSNQTRSEWCRDCSISLSRWCTIRTQRSGGQAAARVPAYLQEDRWLDSRSRCGSPAPTILVFTTIQIYRKYDAVALASSSANLESEPCLVIGTPVGQDCPALLLFLWSNCMGSPCTVVGLDTRSVEASELSLLLVFHPCRCKLQLSVNFEVRTERGWKHEERI